MSTYHSKFLKIDIDIEKLTQLVAEAVCEEFRLKPLKFKCTYPVFRGSTETEKYAAFIKVATKEEWMRTLTVLREVGDNDLLPTLLTEQFIPYGDYAVIVLKWKAGYVTQLDEMTERQVGGLVYGCFHLNEILRKAKHFTPMLGSLRDPDVAWKVVTDYAARHPIAARPLRDLLSLPPDVRRYYGRELTIVHGDFHARNYAFLGGKLASVYDFDKLTQDLSCGDLIQTLVYRFSELNLTRAQRQKLWAVTRKIFTCTSYTREDMVTMAHIWRLRFAAHRIRKHPDSWWVGYDIARRDRRIVELVNIITDTDTF
jgi:hypothetical protein